MIHRWALLIVLTALPANAQSDPTISEAACPRMRMDEPGEAFAKIPTYTQFDPAKAKDGNFCYAATAAQMIDAERFAEGDHELKQLTSPISVAVNQVNAIAQLPKDQKAFEPSNNTDDLLADGLIGYSVNVSAQHPVCDQNFMKTFDHTSGTDLAFGDANSPNIAGPVKFLRSVMNDMDKIRGANVVVDDFGRRVDDMMRTQDSAPDMNATSVLGGYWKCMVHQGSVDGPSLMQALHAAASEPNKQSALGTFMDRFCKDHQFQPKVPQAQILERDASGTTQQAREKKLWDVISRQLSAKVPRPTGVGYCINVLKNRTYHGIDDGSPGMPGDCTPHASVVIGRQFNKVTGHCDFLIRNDYGAKCRTADGRLTSDWPCTEKGDLLVDSQAFLHSLYEVDWIPPNK